ncbi:MAG: hypothetical protein M0R49_07915 [Limnochordia bacterium]|nr:hypothetical protein [Limnochordia bacterium]
MERKSKIKEQTAPVEKAVAAAPKPEPKPKPETGPPLIQWRKNGPGSLRLKTGKIVKQNEVFWAKESDVSPAFRKCIAPIDPNTYIAEKEKPLVVEKATYTIATSKADKGKFDVVNHAGKVINEKPLSLEEAEDLVGALKK